jgi:hypothetical protein
MTGLEISRHVLLGLDRPEVGSLRARLPRLTPVREAHRFGQEIVEGSLRKRGLERSKVAVVAITRS